MRLPLGILDCLNTKIQMRDTSETRFSEHGSQTTLGLPAKNEISKISKLMT